MQRGTLVSWQADRGFGFIKPERENAPNVFIHISVLKQMARPPEVGDVILFQTEVQPDGKARAAIARIEGVAVKSQPKGRDKSGNNVLTGLIKWVALAAVVGFAAPKILPLLQLWLAPPTEQPAYMLPVAELPSTEPAFRCEGKTHCSQMRSCEEAEFYLANCPGTEMDGDRDGIPCERQLCGH
ncbi:excalibur calcium-binding domain-containing protein [Shewanella sp. JM162201]|uniref:Excalibur calcium-binding domain-containing protein n=1 Tax=Shewanella jiangmenensis TaxID=2837387 RepID=A0ABS5V281_9GAMM|nr:excalibur calcium-binding domain-containing protein [Shewanella jiangmenensis]MBT1443927.1 excalibur calcium-binding domain-containing protein [Shewanella jiangmenensis]